MDSYLEKQNAALLKALSVRAEKDHDYLLRTVIEQQKQILILTKEVQALKNRDSVRRKQVEWLYKNK